GAPRTSTAVRPPSWLSVVLLAVTNCSAIHASSTVSAFPMLITLSRLECERESDSGVRQHVDQCIHRESVCALVREVTDSRLADAKPPPGLNLRDPLACLISHRRSMSMALILALARSSRTGAVFGDSRR